MAKDTELVGGGDAGAARAADQSAYRMQHGRDPEEGPEADQEHVRGQSVPFINAAILDRAMKKYAKLLKRLADR